KSHYLAGPAREADHAGGGLPSRRPISISPALPAFSRGRFGRSIFIRQMDRSLPSKELIARSTGTTRESKDMRMNRRFLPGKIPFCLMLGIMSAGVALSSVPLAVSAGRSLNARQSDRWYFAVSGDSRDCGDLIMPKIAKAILSNQREK